MVFLQKLSLREHMSHYWVASVYAPTWPSNCQINFISLCTITAVGLSEVRTGREQTPLCITSFMGRCEVLASISLDIYGILRWAEPWTPYSGKNCKENLIHYSKWKFYKRTVEEWEHKAAWQQIKPSRQDKNRLSSRLSTNSYFCDTVVTETLWSKRPLWKANRHKAKHKEGN